VYVAGRDARRARRNRRHPARIQPSGAACRSTGCSAAFLARFARGEEAVSSNRTIPTGRPPDERAEARANAAALKWSRGAPPVTRRSPGPTGWQGGAFRGLFFCARLPQRVQQPGNCIRVVEVGVRGRVAGKQYSGCLISCVTHVNRLALLCSSCVNGRGRRRERTICIRWPPHRIRPLYLRRPGLCRSCSRGV
jgi:hypothetical protein